MRATTQREALLKTLGKVKSAVVARPTLPVLSNILIRAGGGELTLTATDLEVALTASCKANVTRQGAIAVLPKTLEAFLKAVKDEKVALSIVDKNRLKVEAGAITTLEGFEAQDYPSVPGVKGKAIVVVTGLADALKQISYAMARDEAARPALSGAYFASENGSMVLTATDGYRLAETKVRAKEQIEPTIVPAKAIQFIEKLMPGKVSIHRVKKAKVRPTISFVGEGLVLTAMVIESKFPNYKHLIPQNGSPLTLEKKALQSALDIVKVTLPGNNAVRLQTRSGKLIISTNSDEGNTEVKVPAKGKAMIAFDINYLKDVLARSSEKFIMRTSSPQNPVAIRQNGTVHVLMPMANQW